MTVILNLFVRIVVISAMRPAISQNRRLSLTISENLKASMTIQSFDIEGVRFGSGSLSFLLGPCVVESRDHALFMAQEINDICKHVGVDFVYKSSFDKANRSSVESFRGEGMDFGLDVLRQVKQEIGVPVITDIHEP